ncbi:nucleotidyltransferase family protein [Stutzerimonas zhaodongensis]|uniref:nucleotidyltransferase family protein n=1 Tax=Stutzerimonas TaxID=2901164 RepID=UPI00388DF48D
MSEAHREPAVSKPISGVCALVLAAGKGSRYRERVDEDKLLASSNGSPDAPSVLAVTLNALVGVAERTVVVTRTDNHALLAWLGEARPAGVDVFAVRSNGLGHSLAQAVARYPAAQGWLVVLGDMPYVRPETIRRIASGIHPDRLILPCHQGQRGNPRGIGANHRAALMALDGERGAQALFADGSVVEIEVDDDGVLQDIDRPEDRRTR